MSSPKWSGKSKKYNPNRTFVMSESSPVRRFNPKSTFMPSGFSPKAGTPAASPGVPGGPVPTLGEQVEMLSLYHPPLHPLQYQLYAPTPFRNHLAPPEAHERRAEDLAAPEDLRRELTERNTQTLQIMPAPGLPDHVHTYHSLSPLDLGPGDKERELFGEEVVVTRYKAVSYANARAYVLLRIDNAALHEHENPLQIVNKWRRVQSSAVVGVVEAFTTLSFGTQKPSLVVVYEYYPLSVSLASKEFVAPMSMNTFFYIAVQLAGALQAVHRRGLACRGLVNERYVLLQSGSASGYQRVRLGSLGVPDILGGALSARDCAAAEREDYIDLGRLLTRISARSGLTGPANPAGLPAGLGSPGPQPHNEFTDLLDALSRADKARIDDLLYPYALRAADLANRRIDDLEDVLSQELENGRVFRLLAKIEFVLEGSDPADPRSPLYALHLFRKFVFGQHTEQGRPALNLAHALAALNKLDAGIDENVLLVSADAKTRIILSYKELHQTFAHEFNKKATPESAP